MLHTLFFFFFYVSRLLRTSTHLFLEVLNKYVIYKYTDNDKSDFYRLANGIIMASSRANSEPYSFVNLNASAHLWHTFCSPNIKVLDCVKCFAK